MVDDIRLKDSLDNCCYDVIEQSIYIWTDKVSSSIIKKFSGE